MDYNNIENNIKDSFRQYEPELNHDEIWDNIEPSLKKRKKRRFLFIWLFGGFALIGLFILSQFNSNEKSVKSRKISSASKTKDTVNTSDESLIEKVINPANLTSKNMDSQHIVKAERPNKKENKNSLQRKQTNKVSSKNITPTDPNKKTNVTRKIKKSQKAYTPNSSEHLNTLNSEKEIAINTNVENKTEKISLTENTQEASINQNTLIAQKNEVDILKEKEDKRLQEERRKQETVKKANEKRKAEYKKKNPVKKVSRRSKKKVNYFIQPTASAIIPIRSLKDKSDLEQKGYIANRKETERQLEAFALGLNLIAKTRRGLILFTGIEIQRLNSRYSFTETKETVEVRDGVIAVTENGIGQIISTTVGPTQQTLITMQTQRIHNNHTFINLPIGIGKHWSNRKYDFQLMSGLNFNLHHNFNGLISGPNRDLDMRVRGNRTFNKTFKRKTGTEFWLSSTFQKTINKNVSLSLAPRIQIPFSSLTSTDYVLDQRFIKLSLTLGATYWIQDETEQKK